MSKSWVRQAAQSNMTDDIPILLRKQLNELLHSQVALWCYIMQSACYTKLQKEKENLYMFHSQILGLREYVSIALTCWSQHFEHLLIKTISLLIGEQATKREQQITSGVKQFGIKGQTICLN